MGMKLKTFLASMAMLVATAAHAMEAASSSPSAGSDAAYRGAATSAGQAAEHVTPGRYPGSDGEAASGQEDAANLFDQHAAAGGGSGEPTPDRAATRASETQVEADWNRQEFLRNVQSTP